MKRRGKVVAVRAAQQDASSGQSTFVPDDGLCVSLVLQTMVHRPFYESDSGHFASRSAPKGRMRTRRIPCASSSRLFSGISFYKLSRLLPAAFHKHLDVLIAFLTCLHHFQRWSLALATPSIITECHHSVSMPLHQHSRRRMSAAQEQHSPQPEVDSPSHLPRPASRQQPYPSFHLPRPQ